MPLESNLDLVEWRKEALENMFHQYKLGTHDALLESAETYKQASEEFITKIWGINLDLVYNLDNVKYS
jgi:hypothetical protein